MLAGSFCMFVSLMLLGDIAVVHVLASHLHEDYGGIAWLLHSLKVSSVPCVT